MDDGITVPLFTADGTNDVAIQGGMLDGSPVTLTFGSLALGRFEILAKYRPDDPPFCMEFWNGWFDHWGTAHHTGHWSILTKNRYSPTTETMRVTAPRK